MQLISGSLLPGSGHGQRDHGSAPIRADIIKLFPDELYGAKAIKAFHGPLPQAQFMPTGGVSADNLNDWLDQGAVAVGLGGSLTKGAKTGDFDAVTKEAKKLVGIVQSRMV